jgi:hypothetical protein
VGNVVDITDRLRVEECLKITSPVAGCTFFKILSKKHSAAAEARRSA